MQRQCVHTFLHASLSSPLWTVEAEYKLEDGGLTFSGTVCVCVFLCVCMENDNLYPWLCLHETFPHYSCCIIWNKQKNQLVLCEFCSVLQVLRNTECCIFRGMSQTDLFCTALRWNLEFCAVFSEGDETNHALPHPGGEYTVYIV